MKNKLFLLVVVFTCLAVLASVKPVSASVVSVTSSNAKKSCVSTPFSHHEAILCESDIDFSVATVKASSHDNVQTQEKQCKYKLPVGENLRIEFSVENYIVYTELLTEFHYKFSKLRRLNI